MMAGSGEACLRAVGNSAAKGRRLPAGVSSTDGLIPMDEAPAWLQLRKDSPQKERTIAAKMAGIFLVRYCIDNLYRMLKRPLDGLFRRWGKDEGGRKAKEPNGPWNTFGGAVVSLAAHQ